MGQLWTSKYHDESFSGPRHITPVRYVCSKCGWASVNIRITCKRCGQQFTEWTSMNTQQVKKSISAKKFLKANESDAKWSPGKRENIFKRTKSTARRSRCFSRTFAMNVTNPLGIVVPEPLQSEEIFSTSQLARDIVRLTRNKATEDVEKVFLKISHMLRKEKAKGTIWKRIADETIMELIIFDINVYNFARALISAYGVSAYSIGRFLATPPDEETISLIEEAICQDSLSLFEELLQLNGVMRGLLECQELREEARKILLKKQGRFFSKLISY